MKKTSRLFALACAATLLSNPLAVLANDAAAPLGDGRPIVLAQITQKAKPKRDGTGGSVCPESCPKGQVCRCFTSNGERYCYCGAPRTSK